MRVLNNLEPACVFHFFEEICGIPHTSFHEQQLSDYLVNFAKERGLYYEQDALGNVVIISPATKGYEDVEPIMLQGHIDMVGDQAPDCEIDLKTDGLRLGVEDDWIYAKGTTLGADNGIAVAYMLAVLDSKELCHPRLEAIFTVSEEVGLLGAAAIDLSSCKANRLLNIDSEEEGIFTAGCAGGVRVQCDIPMKRIPDSGLCLDFKFEGILGGHSGIEINKGLANANLLTGRFLSLLKNSCNTHIIRVVGGVKENVIPKDAMFSLLAEPEDLLTIQEVLGDFNAQIQAAFASTDANARLIMSNAGISDAYVLDDASEEKLIRVLSTIPNGVQAMCEDLPDLVQTSLNMGVISLTNDNFQLCFSVRSSVSSEKKALVNQITELTQSLGGTVSCSGDYPAWPYAKDSKLRRQCVEVYEQLYKETPQIVTIHAGLECGIFSEKRPGLDCISIGPNLKDIHTIQERASISSIARVWEFIKVILALKA